MTHSPLHRLKRCTWTYDARLFPQLANWRCIHTVVPDTERCGLHPQENDR